MRTSESIIKFSVAFKKAQAALEGLKKDGTNPHFNSKFATLEACYGACHKQLHDNGISLLQVPGFAPDGSPMLTTRLQHESGEFMEGDYPLKPSKPDPQGYGSAITYARRYCICAMVGLCPEDDDGNDASRKPAPAQRTVPVNGNGSKSGAGDKFRSLVAMWSSVNPEDLSDACMSVLKACGLPTDRKKLTGAHLAQAIKWTQDQMNAEVSFTDAVAHQEV